MLMLLELYADIFVLCCKYFQVLLGFLGVLFLGISLIKVEGITEFFTMNCALSEQSWSS